MIETETDSLNLRLPTVAGKDQKEGGVGIESMMTLGDGMTTMTINTGETETMGHLPLQGTGFRGKEIGLGIDTMMDLANTLAMTIDTTTEEDTVS